MHGTFGDKTQMKELIESAIKNLTANAKKAEKADDALKFTQAALNLAHTLATMEQI